MMFASSSYMDPYFSQNKEHQVPYPFYPFYPYPVPRPDPSAQPSPSYAPFPYHFYPTQPNGYYIPRPPFGYEMPHSNFPNYYHPSLGQIPSYYPAKYPQAEHITHEKHCCGCPNHICHEKKERKGAEFPWPIIWMPEDETKEKEKKNARNKAERDEEMEQLKKERKGAEFPWPTIWMPEDETKEKEKEKRNAQQFPWPVFWMPEEEDETKERRKDSQHANKRASEEGVKTNPSFRIIPLKFLENGDKNHQAPLIEKKQGVEEAEVKNIPVLEKKERSNKEKDGVNTEKKRSKLPPVCLRVDPLPNKRATNGASKEKDKKEVKVVDVKGASKDESKRVEVEVKKETKEKLIPEGRNDDVKRYQISEQDAALLIQSAYRGYNVRRLDPVNKLKRIRGLYENARELMKKLQDVEESGKQMDKKEQLVLGESIMNLLLQLDTIQGLHPTVREARKSVAKELISLQEKLDSLEKQKALEMPPTNEIPQPQMEMQPATATNDTSQCSATQEEDERSPESAAIDDSPPVEAPVLNEDHTCSVAREESTQVTPLLEETGVGSTENVVSDATMEKVPSAAGTEEFDGACEENVHAIERNADAKVENVELQTITEADKVEDEEISVKEKEDEVTALPGTEEYSIPRNEENSDIQHVVEVDEHKSEVLSDAMQTDETKVLPEVGKLRAEEKKLVEENEKLREMLEELMEAGRNQLDIISGLSERVKGLERKLEKKAAKKRSKVRVRKHRPIEVL